MAANLARGQLNRKKILQVRVVVLCVSHMSTSISGLTRDGTAEPVSREDIILSSANGERKKTIFPVQLTTSRIDDHTGPVHAQSAIICDVMTIGIQYTTVVPVEGMGKERRTKIGHGVI